MMLTNDHDGDELPPTTAASGSDETAIGRPPDETEVVAPATEAAPELAWSASERYDDDAPTEVFTWRATWTTAAAITFCALLIAGACTVLIRGWSAHHNAPRVQPSGAPVHAAATAPAAAKPSVDDDEYVAVAFSPADVNGTLRVAHGTAGTQERADKIALTECQANPANRNCILVNAGMFHGCVGLALDASRHSWGGGSGSTADAARAAAIGRLDGSVSWTFVQCSDPPGIIKYAAPSAAPSPAAAAAPAPPPTTMTAAPPPARVPAPESVDEEFLAALRRAQIKVDDRGSALNGARRVCMFFTLGYARQSIVDAVKANADSPGVTDIGAADYVADAIAFYCPQYAGN